MNSVIKVITITSDSPASTVSRSRLREIREQKGLSRRHIAEQLGVTIAAVQDYERSEAAGRITLKTLRKYAEVLGCEVTVTFTPNEAHFAAPTSPRLSKTQRKKPQPSAATAQSAPAKVPANLQDRMGLWSASVED